MESVAIASVGALTFVCLILAGMVVALVHRAVVVAQHQQRGRVIRPPEAEPASTPGLHGESERGAGETWLFGPRSSRRDDETA